MDYHSFLGNDSSDWVLLLHMLLLLGAKKVKLIKQQSENSMFKLRIIVLLGESWSTKNSVSIKGYIISHYI